MTELSTSRQQAKVLIVDDHPMVREGISSRIAGQPDLYVCGEAETENEALAKINETRPDVVIVDISLHEGHGIELLKRIKAKHPDTRAVVHSMYDDTVYAERALEAGAKGYVNKRMPPDRLLEAIRGVLEGKLCFSDDVLKSSQGNQSAASTTPVDALSDRELEIFTLIGEGMTTGAIAKRLHVSTHTVDTHRANIKRKLNLKNAGELNRRAVEWALENR